MQNGMFALHLKAGRIPWGVGGEGAEEIDTGRCGEGGGHGGRQDREIMVGVGKEEGTWGEGGRER